MSFITIYHQLIIQGTPRSDLALYLTQVHHNVTSASLEDTQVMFRELDRYTVYSGGHEARGYVRIVVEMKTTVSDEDNMRLLRGVDEAALGVLRKNRDFRSLRSELVLENGTRISGPPYYEQRQSLQDWF